MLTYLYWLIFWSTVINVADYGWKRSKARRVASADHEARTQELNALIAQFNGQGPASKYGPVAIKRNRSRVCAGCGKHVGSDYCRVCGLAV